MTRYSHGRIPAQGTRRFIHLPPAATHTLADVPVLGKEWMEPWVDQLYSRGITTGCGASPLTYCPEDSVTRAAIAVFIGHRVRLRSVARTNQDRCATQAPHLARRILF